MEDNKVDCIIEQWKNGKGGGFQIINEPKGFKAFWDTVAITKVYLKEDYKKQLETEFHYSY